MPSTIKYPMNNSRATENYTKHLHRQHALLQLLTLHHYRELCYQMYLVGVALAEYNAANKVTSITNSQGEVVSCSISPDMEHIRQSKTIEPELCDRIVHVLLGACLVGVCKEFEVHP